MVKTLSSLVLLFSLSMPVYAEDIDTRLIGFSLDSYATKSVNDLLTAAGNTTIKVYEAAVNTINGAAFDNDIILISSGVFKWSLWKTGNYSLAEAMLAHEIGHRIFKHKAAISSVANRNKERAADYYGALLLYKSGKGCQLQVNLSLEMLKLRDNIFDMYYSDTHPDAMERLGSAIKNCKSLTETGKLPADLYFEGDIK